PEGGGGGGAGVGAGGAGGGRAPGVWGGGGPRSPAPPAVPSHATSRSPTTARTTSVSAIATVVPRTCGRQVRRSPDETMATFHSARGAGGAGGAGRPAAGGGSRAARGPPSHARGRASG